MTKPTTFFVGLDSHKDFISIAHAEAGRSGPTTLRSGTSSP